MNTEATRKITRRHLERDAYLYVRQSTLHQVVENTESTKRQYALRQRAVALGWPTERVHVIDMDLGESGASQDRKGFQKLVAEVGMGHAGIVLGLEVSRLARNSSDWHRLLEICAITDTLILDEDGIYDPTDFNDRLLLGLKGTMSEAELYMLRARLRGGILNKARRGELQGRLPIGFIYDMNGRVKRDPDRRIQDTVRFLFETYRRTGSATATVKVFRKKNLPFPRRPRTSPRNGDVNWAPLTLSLALGLLHNPRYAGAFFFGKTRQRKLPNGKIATEKLPRDEWTVLLPEAHEGYISWPEYEANQRRLQENAQPRGAERPKSPPREGPALLQGVAICGRCGKRMSVRYHVRGDYRVPDYLCQRDAIEHAQKLCQVIPGTSLDEAIGELLIEVMTPRALEAALAVQNEIQARFEEADRLRRQRVERARYEVEQAKRRYMHVDPANRLVADDLEAEWNEKLRALQEAQEEYERQREADRAPLGEEEKARIMKLAADFPRLWREPATPQRERKRMVRLLIEDVTMIRGDMVKVHVRFKGGAVRTLALPLPLRSWQKKTTDPEVVKEIGHLLDEHTDEEIAAILNERGVHSGAGKHFHPRMIGRLRRSYGLKSRYQRLREAGMLTGREMAQTLGVTPRTVKKWAEYQLLVAHRYNNKNQWLYTYRDGYRPTKHGGIKHSICAEEMWVGSERTSEVQYEA